VSNGAVFSDIATKYDRINRILSLGQDQAWRRRVVDQLPQGRLLDLGAGTGAALPILTGRDVVALDPAPQMLALNSAPRRVVAVGERLPFRDETFDAVFSAYVVRNLNSLNATIAEVSRVLVPGGRLGIVDLGRPRNPVARAVHRVGTAAALNAIGLLFRARDEYRYLHHSLDELPPPEEMYANRPLRLESTWRMGPLGFVYGAILSKVR
jgi:demethylmenaquinone methyltransferase / 2-methoxy-6-polyprenyl-1,4-benzoquinol methylase